MERIILSMSIYSSEESSRIFDNCKHICLLMILFEKYSQNNHIFSFKEFNMLYKFG
jgi:hypothetical protein